MSASEMRIQRLRMLAMLTREANCSCERCAGTLAWCAQRTLQIMRGDAPELAYDCPPQVVARENLAVTQALVRQRSRFLVVDRAPEALRFVHSWRFMSALGRSWS